MAPENANLPSSLRPNHEIIIPIDNFIVTIQLSMICLPPKNLLRWYNFSIPQLLQLDHLQSDANLSRLRGRTVFLSDSCRKTGDYVEYENKKFLLKKQRSGWCKPSNFMWFTLLHCFFVIYIPIYLEVYTIRFY